MRSRLAPLALGTLLAVLAGCKVGPDYIRPELPSPEEYRQGAVTAEQQSLANTEWFDIFDNPALQALIETALAGNQDLQAATWRIEAARARLGISRSNLFPGFGYQAGAGVSDGSDNLNVPTPRTEDYFAGVTVSWEIDLWGRLRRSNEAARATLVATEWGRRATIVALVADVARLYFQLRDFDARLEIARRTLSSRRASTALIRERFEGGITSELDVRQAEVQEAITAAAVPFFERQVVLTENALSFLAGREPGPIVRGRTLMDQDLPTATPAGLPSGLLERRPDVVRSEALLEAQMARIGVAKALRFPRLNLTGFLGLESEDLSDLVESDSRDWSIGGEILGPIFEFGRNRRRVEVQRALTEELILGYESTVLGAFREVEDALISTRKLREEATARRQQVESSVQAAMLSRARYDGGVTSYLEVLDSERTLFDAELDAARTLQESYNAVVDLYAALGGGWDPDEIVELPPARVPGSPDAPREDEDAAGQD